MSWRRLSKLLVAQPSSWYPLGEPTAAVFSAGLMQFTHSQGSWSAGHCSHCLQQSRWVKVPAGDVRSGVLLDIDGTIYRVTKFNVRPGSRVHLDIKDVRTGRKVTKKVKPTENLEAVTLSPMELEIQYVMDDIVFMTEKAQGDQVEAPLEFFGANRELLVPGLEVTGMFYEGTIALVNLPNQIRAKVVSTEPDDDAGFVKATLESGGQVKLPDKVVKGQTAIFRTDTSEFVGVG